MPSRRNTQKRRRTMKRKAKRLSKRLSKRKGLVFASRKQRGGNLAFKVPPTAIRDYRSMEDEGTNPPILVTEELAEKLEEDHQL